MMLRAMVALLAWAAIAAPVAAQGEEVLISAAASLTEVIQQLAKVYESRSGDRLVLNVGASNTLARQIAAGARVDVFISGDEAQMDVVAADVVPGTRVDLLSNQLAIAVPDDRARQFTSVRELADASIRRIAVGDPAAVPAGVYAKAYLQRIGLWTAVESKLIPSGSVRVALAAIENGAADAAIVYRTDVATARRARLAFVVPTADGPTIVYPAAAMRTGANPQAARRLLAFLQTPEAAAIFRRAGFLTLT